MVFRSITWLRSPCTDTMRYGVHHSVKLTDASTVFSFLTRTEELCLQGINIERVLCSGRKSSGKESTRNSVHDNVVIANRTLKRLAFKGVSFRGYRGEDSISQSNESNVHLTNLNELEIIGTTSLICCYHFFGLSLSGAKRLKCDEGCFIERDKQNSKYHQILSGKEVI